jgi:long-chain acyl-CoA synthetase
MATPGEIAERDPDRPAVIMATSGETVTFRQLEDRSNQVAQLLRGRGLQPGDSVAIVLENHHRFHEILWAAQRAGLYYTAINSHLTADEVAYIVDDCEAAAVISSAALAPVAAGLTPDVVPKVKVRLMVDGPIEGWESYEEAVGSQPTEPIADQFEGDFLLYSSGTTGRPKGIKRALTGLRYGDKPDMLAPLISSLGFEDGDLYLSPAPLYHAAPLAWTMGAQRLGGTVIVMERFDPTHALQLIERHRVTHSQMVPTMFVRMLKLPPEERLRYDMSSLKAVIHAAAPCPVEVKRQMIEWWGPIILEYWSSTEASGATFITSQEWLEHPGSVGRAVVGVLHILDDEGNELPPGQPGTIWVEGAPDFEYHNDAAKTASTRNERGWTTVGDIGYLDEDGYLFLTDRKSFMIISGGVNIYPQESENVLVNHPKVMDVAVIGVPNPDFGEEVKAVVQPMSWDDVGPELEQELLAYCREKLAAYKCPRSVDFEKELPRLDTGKLYKRLLRDRYWAAAST